jgi:hypothetical protein
MHLYTLIGAVVTWTHQLARLDGALPFVAHLGADRRPAV